MYQLLKEKKDDHFYQCFSGIYEIFINNDYVEKNLIFYISTQNDEFKIVHKAHCKKRVNFIFNYKDRIMAIDKFGNIYQFELKSLIENFLSENEFSEIDQEPLIIGNLFQNTICLFKDEKQNLLVLSDDYYKIKILNLENMQEILKIFSFRKFYLNFIFDFQGEKILIFDDGKFYRTKSCLLKLEEEFEEGKLIDGSQELLKNGQVASKGYVIEENKIIFIYFEERDEKINCEVRILRWKNDKFEIELVKNFDNLCCKIGFLDHNERLHIGNKEYDLFNLQHNQYQ